MTLGITYQDLSKRFLAGSTPILCKIEHESLDEPIYLTDNNKPIIFEENNYMPCYMKAKLPSSSADSDGSASITISAVDQQMIQLSRTINSPATFTILACYYPRTGIITKLDSYKFSLTGITCDAVSFSAELTNDLALNYSFPNGESTPITTPGVS